MTENELKIREFCAKTFQRKVYEHVAAFIGNDNIKRSPGRLSVLDLGCGIPFKLKEFIYPLTEDIVGVDTKDVISQLSKYNFGHWVSADLNIEALSLHRSFDVIICADVIEHLTNPNNLLEIIKRHCHEKTVIFMSTPDYITTPKDLAGNPINIQHVKEWSLDELGRHLRISGLEIIETNNYIENSGNYPYKNIFFTCKRVRPNKKKKILVSLPNVHWIHTHVVKAAMLLIADNRYDVQLIMPAHKPYVNNLHHIVKDFSSGDFDFWLNIDADNPPLKNPLDLVSLDKDIIGLPTPIWHFVGDKKGERPVYWNAYDYRPKNDAYAEHMPREGLQRVDAIGTGCFLIAARVFKNYVMKQAPFARVWSPEGIVIKGNDMAFCARATSAGFEIYCHYDYPCDHFSELSLNETVRAFKELYGDAR